MQTKPGKACAGEVRAVRDGLGLTQEALAEGPGVSSPTVNRWENGSRSGISPPVFATEISSIDPLPHQRIAVYNRMLREPRLRFLLADAAAAGKTMMMGLYIREMLSRRRLRRILIVPPAGLVRNWQSEMQSLFSLPFRIVSDGE